jgi:hypothetical protein
MVRGLSVRLAAELPLGVRIFYIIVSIRYTSQDAGSLPLLRPG